MLKAKLLATKFHRPQVPARWVKRPHLIRRLDEGLELDRQVTLVSAPAGFGKSTCISEWVSTLVDLPVAWLSLDPADDDPIRFLTYLVAALQSIDPHIGGEIEGVIHSGQLPPVENISVSLIHDFLNLGTRFVLVLDDFQLLQDPFVIRIVEQLIFSQAPTLHLVVLTREDPPLPLARLRANNHLTEIRAKDLRFSRRDIDRFLTEVMGLSLSQRDIDRLDSKTEGWVVGLQLAGLSMQDRADPSKFIATLSGSHRFILSYLTEQVLSQQPETVQQFLLQTSILDKFNSDLCNAVAQRSDSRALLDQLFNANLFLVPLDDDRYWYRYHHLFADLLRDRQNALQSDHTNELHRRASQWYVGADMLSDAIRHALAGEDYVTAVKLLETHAMEMVMQGYARTVHGWVESIPEQWRVQSPHTNLAFAWMQMLRGSYNQARPYINRVEDAFSDPRLNDRERDLIRADWLVMQTLVLNMKGKLSESLACARQALELTPQDDDRVLSLAYFGLACSCQAMDEYDQAMDAYQKSIEHGRAAKNAITEMMSTSGLAQLALEHGQLHLAFEIASEAYRRMKESASLPPISTVVIGILGEVCYQWNQVDEARRRIEHALQLSTLGGYTSGMVNCRVLLARVLLLKGDQDSAENLIREAVQLLQTDTPEYVRQEAISQQVRVCLTRNQPQAAEMALHGHGFSFREQFIYPEVTPEENISYSNHLLYNSSLFVLLHQARVKNDLPHLKAGIELADQLIVRASQRGYGILVVETLLLRTQVHAMLDNSQASRADFLSALEKARAEGFIAVFLEQGGPVASALSDLAKQGQLDPHQKDYIQRILAAFSKQQPPTASPFHEPAMESSSTPLVEPLTDRELDVLRLMSEGLKYKEIAARLYISINTVRTHTKAIYAKLSVSNRTKAIETARRLQIL